MRLANQTIKPHCTPVEPAEQKLSAVQVRSAVGLKFESQLKLNPALFYLGEGFGGVRSATGLLGGAGLHLGAPIVLSPNVSLRPFLPLLPMTNQTTAQTTSQTGVQKGVSPESPSALVKATQVITLMDALRGPAEQLAKTHPAFDDPLDILGVIVATPRIWNAVLKPGAKNKTEIFLAGAQAGLSIAKVASDYIPGMHHAKDAIVWTGVLLKLGDQVHAVIHKP